MMTDFWRRREFWLLVFYVIAYGIGFVLPCGIAWRPVR